MGDVFDDAEKQQGDVFDQAAKASPDPLKTGAGMLEAGQAQAHKEASVLPEPKPGFLSRASETLGLTHGNDAVSDAASQVNQIAHHPIDSFVQGSKQLAMAPVHLAYGAMVHPLDTAQAIMPTDRMYSDAKQGNYGAAAGDLLGGVGNTVGLEKGAESLPSMAESSAGLLNKAGLPSRLPEVPATQDRALGQYRRAVAPTSATAEDRAAIDSEFNRSAKYLGDETGPGRQISGGEGGVMRSADRARNAKMRLWDEQVQPHIDNLKDVLRPGQQVADEIRSSFTPLDRATKTAQVAAGEKLAKTFERPMSVGEMADTVKQLNGDKAVSRFYDMNPSEQAQAETADPALRAKVAGLESLRGKLFDAVADNAGEGASADFQNARKDYGALSAVEQRLRDTRVPTPQSVPMRAVNTVKSLLHPGLGSADTLLGLNDPNRLAVGSLNMLGRAGLEKLAPVARMTPFTRPTPLQLGPGPITAGSIPMDETPGHPEINISPDTRAARKNLLLPAGRPTIAAPGIPMDETPSAPAITIANDSRASRKGLLLPEKAGSGQKQLPPKSSAPAVTPHIESAREYLKRTGKISRKAS